MQGGSRQSLGSAGFWSPRQMRYKMLRGRYPSGGLAVGMGRAAGSAGALPTSTVALFRVKGVSGGSSCPAGRARLREDARRHRAAGVPSRLRLLVCLAAAHHGGSHRARAGAATGGGDVQLRAGRYPGCMLACCALWLGLMHGAWGSVAAPDRREWSALPAQIFSPSTALPHPPPLPGRRSTSLPACTLPPRRR